MIEPGAAIAAASVPPSNAEDDVKVNTVPPPGATDAYSKEYVDNLLHKIGGLEERNNTHEALARGSAETRQPEMLEFNASLEQYAVDIADRASIGKIRDWGNSVHKGTRPSDDMDLVRYVCVCSAKDRDMKRKVDEASGATEALRDKCAENDKLKDELKNAKMRIEEAVGLANDRQDANADLIRAKAAAEEKEGKHLFVKASAREVGATDGNAGESSAAGSSSANPLARAQNPLADFIRREGHGDQMVRRASHNFHAVYGGASDAPSFGASIHR
jgi:hypothetical protein